MSIGLLLAIAGSGGLGAVARFAADTAIRRRFTGPFPLATMIINLTGSLLLGLLTGLIAGRLLDPVWPAVLGPGFLGGYTTFSTASFETVRLAQERRGWATLLHGLGMLVAGVLLAALGFTLGRAA